MSTRRRIRKAAVLGAGVMGAGLAAQLANAGLDVLLLDRSPDGPEQGTPRGKDGASAARLAAEGLQRALRSSPASFFTPASARRVEVGSFEHELPLLAQADWVVEAVLERLDVKEELFARVAPHLHAGAVLSSNTSGLSCAALSDALPPELRSRFLVTHFFNPPRYLHLLEIVPGPECAPEVVEALSAFCERRLGKGVVLAADTPNFIANRIGVFGFLQSVALMLDSGLSVAEVDALTGPVLGRPSSATFRTADLVGLDVLLHTAGNMTERLPEGPERRAFELPPFLSQMVEQGWLGAKSGQGFYRKQKAEGRTDILMLDPASMEYRPRVGPAFPSLQRVARMPDTAARVAALCEADDGAGRFAWAHLSAVMDYAARCVPEVSPDLLRVDRALRWGFGWDLGPFELWDALGVERCAGRFEREGRELPPVVAALRDAGLSSFHARTDGVRRVFDPVSATAVPVLPRPRVLSLVDRRAAGALLAGNDEASLVDLGQDVACLQFHSVMNTLGAGTADMLQQAVERVEASFRGLVVGNEAPDFSAGANLALLLGALQEGDHAAVEGLVRRFQDINQLLRFCSRPVVVAPRGRTLGGGCEMLLHGAGACAAAESYIGLVEVGAGLIPAGGGCKELLRRLDEALPQDLPELDLLPFLQRLFGVVGMGRVSTSAEEARLLGFLGPADRVSMNADHLLHDARSLVLFLDEAGYTPPRPREDIRVMGRPGLAALRVGLWNFAEAGQISAHDGVVAGHLSRVLCGGDVDGPARVSETYLLELEREAFLSLCGEQLTLERMEHLLKKGKPLRN